MRLLFPLLTTAILMAGCTAQEDGGVDPPACDPLTLAAVPEEGVVRVEAALRNCGTTPLAVATQACNAPWTTITIHVVEMPPGRLPRGWGVLTGDGDSRALLERFVEECPPSYEQVGPGQSVSTTAAWNGTFLRDACAGRSGEPGDFTCPVWTEAPGGRYRFEAWGWRLDGEAWEARVEVAWRGEG